ncbi:hypothetical protein ACF044_16230 [Microbacterium sp. NPDC016588]|uniref:hypothetical protein n=1 Tax=Microbacterium TaxID=33882 RepID=UPI0007F43C0B|nr:MULTISPECIES: hypothetical protein [unclassified Microbacterium]OAN39380.1 hypothetical protein A4X16_14735 [Microbacterium sp. H83]TCJ20647.1 hypothetical protein E0W80_18835 [Microbacterium sp. PI-1]
MSIATRPRPVPREIPAELVVRLRRLVTGVAFVVLAVGAGYLGLLLAPILDRLIVAALAVILVPLLVVVVVDFFRSPD